MLTMKPTAVWIVGAPGVGKTSIAREIMEFDKPYVLHPSPKWTVGSEIVAAGHYDGSTFDGSDTVPYSGAKVALDYWQSKLLPAARLTIFDGDRFSDIGCFERVRSSDVVLRIVHVVASDEVLSQRRMARGSTQSPSWMKGRATKAARFAKLDSKSILLESSAVNAASPKELAVIIMSFLCS